MIKQKAFSVIELLVVIGIITILTAILLPTLTRARTQGDNLKCKTNLHQYAIALEEYTNNNNDYLPNPYSWLYKTKITGFCQWHDKENFPANRTDNAGSMWEYLNEAEVHLCPTFRKLAKTRGLEHPFHYEHPDLAIIPQYSYTFNRYLGESKFGSLKSSSIRHPAGIFSFSEQNMFSSASIAENVLCNSYLYIMPGISLTGKYNYNNFASYHNIKNNDYCSGFANAVFLDGHVQLVSPRDNPYRYARPK